MRLRFVCSVQFTALLPKTRPREHLTAQFGVKSANIASANSMINRSGTVDAGADILICTPNALISQFNEHLR